MYEYDLVELEDFEFNHYIHHFDEYEEQVDLETLESELIIEYTLEAEDEIWG